MNEAFPRRDICEERRVGGEATCLRVRVRTWRESHGGLRWHSLAVALFIWLGNVENTIFALLFTPRHTSLPRLPQEQDTTLTLLTRITSSLAAAARANARPSEHTKAADKTPTAPPELLHPPESAKGLLKATLTRELMDGPPGRSTPPPPPYSQTHWKLRGAPPRHGQRWPSLASPVERY